MEVVWGHSTGVTESEVRDFADWVGTGTVENPRAGDSEQIALGPGEYMLSETVDTGTEHVLIDYNVYQSGDNLEMHYRHGATAAACAAASWQSYTSSFVSLGFVQFRLRHPTLWWDPDDEGLAVVAAYKARHAASLAASMVNLANPGTYNLTVVGSTPTWDAEDGWSFSSGAFDTGYNLPEECTFLVRYTDAGSVTYDTVFGTYDNPPGNYSKSLTPRTVDRTVYGAGDWWNFGGWSASGRMAISGKRCFYNGVYRGEPSYMRGKWPSDWSAYIGGDNYYDACSQPFAGKIQAVVIYSENLTDEQVAKIDAAVAEL